MRILFVFLFLSFSALAEKVVITSNPVGASVYVVKQGSKSKEIGKTPYEVNLGILQAEGEPNVALQISVRKQGFDDYNIVLPPIGGADIKIMANLNVQKDIKLTQDFDLLVTDLFDVLRMTRGRDFDSADKKIDMLLKKFPHFSIVYEMKAMGYYLRKEFKKSLNFYRKAFAVNPKNREAYRMKKYLEKKFKIEDRI